ncbi:outer membrane lipid asymmetry maintenance protein MlaD [Perlucidibaca piscinae]|uniref:outer membrane lipid asymmetry maintenance protein MlaD n=1 Tax=Perlucidibaca piscinae TaxID=392589 RepID=UPI0003B59A36|nr:outer membrane lipid asymmetry maintenance protein MlaD [Perlucidibaca piscinae]
MRMKSLELLVGAFLLAAFLALAFLAMQVSGLSAEMSKPSYRVHAMFQNVGGLTVRAKVTMAGVNIGRVEAIALDPATQLARVDMSIDRDISDISTDTVAAILTAGLLGEKYIGLTPGADETFLKEGSRIEQTQSSLVLEDLIGKFLFNKTQETAPAAAPASADSADEAF